MYLRCIECGEHYPADELRTRCRCGSLLDVELEISTPVDPSIFASRVSLAGGASGSGVWRYRELLPPFPDDVIVSRAEGNTNLYESGELATWAGVARLVCKHEGENPTGSFKDRGMTVATTHARATGARMVACASTGNTSASVASYAAVAGIPAIVFVPEGKISAGKLGQTIAYGARIIQIRGDFDAAMKLVQDAASEFGIYILNSINPFRLEGQKAIVFELLQQLDWQIPDWIVLPGGNLGNSSAFGKALMDLRAAGILRDLPRIGVIQAAGAAPFYHAFKTDFRDYAPMVAKTVASAIQIGDPVSYSKAVRTIRLTEGVVEVATDDEILDAKARIDRAGIGCEPASAASLAGLRKLVASGVIDSGSTVAIILTGNVLKDTDTILSYHLGNEAGHHELANRPVVIDPTLAALGEVLADAD
ncbi:MAG TPA: threonine synthase [Thermomicrobiaceae bacterium]|nr:threonine synthase [Thermomicrobiaceae bacterium]